ncbi:hypothetical protein EDD15DRAFT_2191676 [Pisolithus albus]|nr:hypothetical protein EDD15DRAFT_2191676 [Pisolithus albus]
MSSHGTFNITPKMIHLQAFSWLKQFAEGSILLDTALNSIEFALGSNFDPNEWMELTHHIVMDRDCWPAIEKIFMQELGIAGSSSESHSQPSRVLGMSGMQGPSFSTAVPLLKDPSAWRLMMDWAQDKIGFGELDDRMRAHGPRYIPEEWKTIIDEVFMLSDPGVESAGPASLVVERAMKSQGVTLSTAPATAPSCLAPTPAAAPSSPSSWVPIPEVTFWGPPPVLSSDPGPYTFAPFSYPTSASQYATRRPGKSPCGATRKERRKSSGATQEKRRKSSRGTTQKKRHAEDEDEDEDEDEEEDGGDKRGGPIRRPQEVGPSGKGSYLRSIDALSERFKRGVREGTVSNSPLDMQLPTSIFPPPRKNIYIVEFYSASARTFAFEYIKARGFEATTLPRLPHRLYVEASCPLDVQQSLPPSHCQSHKDIVLLPPQEGTSILTYKARQVLPTRNWVRIKQSTYKGDIGYVEESAETHAVVLVAPRQLPYDVPEESGERMMFDVELARLTGLDFIPIISPSGAEIGYSCGGQQFVRGLLRLTLPVNALELVELPHPDDIRFHVATGVDPPFVEETLNIFSAQFWREHDSIEIQEGDLRGKRGMLADVDLHKRSAVVLCDGDDTFECNLRELCRVFKIGDTVRVIAGPFCGETGYVIVLHERTLVLAVMQSDKSSANIEVSKFAVQSQLPEHVLSVVPEDNELQSVRPLPGDEALPGDVVRAYRGPYIGESGIIEWISSDGKVWIFKHGKGKGKEDAREDKGKEDAPGDKGKEAAPADKGKEAAPADKGKEAAPADGENPAPSLTVVAIDIADLIIERAPNTLTFSKDKGYNVAVGDTVEVVRGQWRHSQGTVKAVDLTKASLDFVRPTDGVQITVPITFCRKIKERFDHGLSKFVGRDVWVIAGDKKGTRATLRTIGRMSSWVELYGQLTQLKNNQIATPAGMLLDGTLLPPQLQRGLKALHSRSFIAPVVPHSVTPPPSPGPSNAGPSDAGPLDAWSITPANIAQMQTPQMQTPDYGDVPWLFQPDFCDFKSFHLGFNVSVGFTQVSLGKRVVRTVCPDRFMGQNGPALPGSVCVTVTGHNSGSAIQHLTIPARYLTPANPTGKNQLCLVLKGPQAGQVVHIKKCQRNSKSVVTEHGVTLNFSDVCVAFEYNRA